MEGEHRQGADGVRTGKWMESGPGADGKSGSSCLWLDKEMKVVYDKVGDGIRILRCFGYDEQVELPERIGGLAVTELGPYVFSEVVRRRAPGQKYLAEVTEGQSDQTKDTTCGREADRRDTDERNVAIRGKAAWFCMNMILIMLAISGLLFAYWDSLREALVCAILVYVGVFSLPLLEHWYNKRM